MKQFLLPNEIGHGERLVLRGADFHYLHRVRRVKKGQTFNCRTTSGRYVACTVEEIQNESMVISGSVQTETTNSMHDDLADATLLHLVQCIPKGKKLDLIVRQAVELGAGRISLIASRHAVPDFGNRWDTKREHLEAIIREAYQQSGGRSRPQLDAPSTFLEFVAANPLPESATGLFFHERELEKSSLHGYLDDLPREIRIVVGPEGGLAVEEILILQDAGYQPVYLGTQILRCETAAAVGLGALSLLVREYPTWSLNKDRKIDEN